MPTDPSECTITASKNKLANIIVFGQLKTNELVKELGGQLPNNAKQLARELIAAAARTLRPDTTTELVRDILHYRSRKVRCLYKEYKSGKCSELSLEQRLIECEKALLNTLEPDVHLFTDFMQQPDIHPNVLEVLGHMHEYIVDAAFRQAVLASLPAQPLDRDLKSIKSEEGMEIKDAESDGDSVHASSSSYEDQLPATVSTATTTSNASLVEQQQQQLHNGTSATHHPHHHHNHQQQHQQQQQQQQALQFGAGHLQIAADLLATTNTLANHSSSHRQATPQREPGARMPDTAAGKPANGAAPLANGNHLSTAASRKRKHEECQLEIIEMKKDLLRLQQTAFEKQIQMFDEMVGALREMRRLLEYQKPMQPLQLAAAAAAAAAPPPPPTTSSTSPLLNAARNDTTLQQLAASYPLLAQLPPNVVNSLAFLQAHTNGAQPQLI